MTTIVLPRLDGDSWIEEPKAQAQQLLSNAIVADYSQSTVFHKNVTSIPYLVASYQNDPAALCLNIAEALKIMYQRYFDSATIDCNYITNPDTSYTISIGILLIKNGITYSIERHFNHSANALSSILTELNK